MDKANLSLVRKINYRVVWEELIRNGANTIVGLKNVTDLSFPTINRSIEYGKEIGLIVDGDIEDSSVGRKAQIYRINKNLYHILVVLAHEDRLVYIGYNATGEELYRGAVEGSYIDLITNIDILIGEVLVLDKNIKSVSLAFAGVVNDGVVVDCLLNQELCGFDLRDYIETKHKVKSVVVNNVKVVAKYLNYVTMDDSPNTFVVIDCGYSGYGVSIVANDRVLQGKNGSAGEVCYLDDLTDEPQSKDSYKKFILPIISICAPNKIFLYTPFGEEYVEEFRAYVKQHVRNNSLPVIEHRKNIDNDMAKGLFGISCEKVLDYLLQQ